MNAKVITVEEARELMPRVREIVHELRKLRAEIGHTRERISKLETLWGDDVRDASNPDADEFARIKRENRHLVRRFRRRAEELDALGCHVKDLDEGIVGFFHVRDGKAVFMSWDMDDPDHEAYEELENNPVVFSVDGARRILPHLRDIFREFDAVGESLRVARHELSLLEVMWGDSGANDHPDVPTVRKLENRIDALVERGRNLERELLDCGCVLKDFQRGLVDFYHVHDGQIVFLCWQRDEPDVVAWHPLDAGFASRQPIDGAAES